MQYTLNNLGSDNFEHLVQTLCKKILGEGVKIYGAGPDGQREATYDGKAPYPSMSNSWEGYWVVQAKFKYPNTNQDDYKWIERCFVNEMNGFNKKQKSGTTIPDNYLFFTNIVLTPSKDVGIKDKLDKLVKSYEKLIPHIHIIGYDDICRFLDQYRDIASAYASFILPGDVLSYLYHNITEQHKREHNALLRFILQSFTDDYCSRMEQAGQVTENKVSIDKVYVDLKFKEENTRKHFFIRESINAGNFNHRTTVLSKSPQKGLKTNQWETFYETNKFVLKGSAGQGKSTVCQFLAQIYRASFYKRFSSINNEQINGFIERINDEKLPQVNCYRIPIRIELRIYSAWIIEQKRMGNKYDILTYISNNITNKSNSEFDVETLRRYLITFSWAFFFDGLDEVPESSNRKEVMEEITKFLKIELQQIDSDFIIFATTRPEGYVGEFDSNEFKHLDLLPMDEDICINYLKKLLNAIENDSTKRAEYLKILMQALENDQIAFMLKTPLQATIMTILVRAGGEPPRDKYSLFKEYFEIIIKREKQKSVDTILNKNQDLIEGVYYLLGFELQKRSSTTDKSDALLPLVEFKDLIAKKLSDDGLICEINPSANLIEDVYNMILNRINFASEIEENKIGFSIRSIQEFLAAVCIAKNYSERLTQILPKIAQSAYWKNTFNFIVEYINKERPDFLDRLIDTILSELNGNGCSIDEYNETASIFWGSQVAFDILVNNTFKNKPKYENKLCRYIENYCKLCPTSNISMVSSMSENVKIELSNYIINTKESDLCDGVFALAAVLCQSEKCFEKLKQFYMSHPAEIVNAYYKVMGNYHSNMYSIASIALNHGEILRSDIPLITSIIKNASNISNKTVKKAIFYMTIKAITKLSRNVQANVFTTINDFFGCNFHLLSKLLYNSPSNYDSVEDYFGIEYLIPKLKRTNFEPLIKLSETYGCTGLKYILETLCENSLDSYKHFLTVVKSLKSEIIELKLDKIISSNAILQKIWLNFLDGKEEYGFLNSSLEKRLSYKQNIVSLDDLLREQEYEINLYSCILSRSENFESFYNTLKKHYKGRDFTCYQNLVDLLSFVYCCQITYAYEEANEENDFELLNKYLKYLPEIFDYTQKAQEYNFWNTIVILIFILNMSKRDYNKYDNILFLYHNKKYAKNVKNFPILENNLRTKIILKLADYISFTGNKAAIECLMGLILDGVQFQTLQKIEWNQFESLDVRFQIINSICNFNDENAVIQNLQNEDLVIFCFKILKAIEPTFNISNLYIYLLRYFKSAGNQYLIRECENDIKTIISSRSIDFNIF